MKKPLAIIFNDVHLQASNEAEIIESVRHMIKYAISKDIKALILMGDLFHIRSFQRQSSLLAFDKILNIAHEAGCTLYLFPGNHDKTLYNSFDSFLDVYRYHPGVKFNRATQNILIGGVKITLLPFFSDDMLVPMINDAEGGDILLSHFEMNGSTHLGKVSNKGSITRKMLKKWKKTYLGHYHNAHEITEDIIHLPSFRQNDFGEDSNKGFTILYDDLSYEIIKGHFKEFTKIIINLDETNSTELEKLIDLHKGSKNIIRFEFIGEESKLKALDRAQFRDSGIDVKIKFEAKFDDDKLEMPKVIKKYDRNQIDKSFMLFCESKGYDTVQGVKFLNEFLEKKNAEG